MLLIGQSVCQSVSLCILLSVCFAKATSSLQRQQCIAEVQLPPRGDFACFVLLVTGLELQPEITGRIEGQEERDSSHFVMS